jgi:flagellar hook-associated protein 2
MGISSSTGLATGIDTDALVSKLMAVEQRPVTLLQNRQAALQASQSAFASLAGKVADFKRLADALANPETLFPRSVTSSDETVATGVATPGAAQGTYTLTVTGLARGSIAAATATTAALTDTIAAAPGTFTFRLGSGGANVTIPVTTTTTLEQLVKAVNDAGAGVRAAAVNVGTAAAPAYKLTLTSTATGSASDIVVATDGTTLNIANTQHADDAHFSIAGIGTFARASNSFGDVISGVTISLKAASGTSEIAIAYNAAALQSSLQGLVTAYNDIVTSVGSQSVGTTGIAGTVTPGVLSAEPVPRSLVAALRQAVGTRVAGAIGSFSDLGIAVARNGTLTLDPVKFKAAIDADPQAVANVVAGTSSAKGVADLLSAAADNATRAVTGSLSVRQKGFDASIKDLQKQIDGGLARLTVRERVLRQQFLTLEETIGKLQQSQSSLTGQLNSLANLSLSLNR